MARSYFTLAGQDTFWLREGSRAYIDDWDNAIRDVGEVNLKQALYRICEIMSETNDA